MSTRDRILDYAYPMRYTAIDAIRGFSSLWVAMFHLFGAAGNPWSAPFIEHGHLGVFVFFVLSGFVIAKNLSGEVTGRTISVFALRRSIRLDPTYWTVIGLTLIAEAVVGRAYSPLAIVANMFYLDNLIGSPSIVKVGWTLCLEVQFYLVYALLIWICDAGSSEGNHRRLLRSVVFSVLLIVSLTLPVSEHIFLTYWYAFFVGVVVWWGLARECSPVVCVVVLATLAFCKPTLEGITTVVTGASILGLAVTNRLGSFAAPAIQFCGRISYSLYLIHPLVARFVRRYDGSPFISLPIGFVTSLALAYMLYRLVEKPTHELARRIGLDTQNINNVEDRVAGSPAG